MKACKTSSSKLLLRQNKQVYGNSYRFRQIQSIGLGEAVDLLEEELEVIWVDKWGDAWEPVSGDESNLFKN